MPRGRIESALKFLEDSPQSIIINPTFNLNKIVTLRRDLLPYFGLLTVTAGDHDLNVDDKVLYVSAFQPEEKKEYEFSKHKFTGHGQIFIAELTKLYVPPKSKFKRRK